MCVAAAIFGSPEAQGAAEWAGPSLPVYFEHMTGPLVTPLEVLASFGTLLLEANIWVQIPVYVLSD